LGYTPEVRKLREAGEQSGEVIHMCTRKHENLKRV
jgi:hypothetical protein